MQIYKLKFNQSDLSDGVLIPALKENIDYEETFENWLENSPNALFPEEENSIIWIARQAHVNVGNSTRIPDLLGIDSAGDLVIVELKKEKSPRDIIAQLLEYSSWAQKLNYDQLNNLHKMYNGPDENLINKFNAVFNPDTELVTNDVFNRNQKLVIIAETISSVVKDVVNYLYTKSELKIYGYEYKILKTNSSEVIVSISSILEPPSFSKAETPVLDGNRWNESILAKDVINEAVEVITNQDRTVTFSPKEVYDEIIKKYPTFNKTTTNCRLIADCVNHTSRRHYPSGQQDRYFLISQGKYRLYNPSTDGNWDSFGHRI